MAVSEGMAPHIRNTIPLSSTLWRVGPCAPKNFITMHNATTARDLEPPRPGQTRHRTSHRHLSSGNVTTLRKLNEGRGQAPPRVALRVDAHRLPPALQPLKSETYARSTPQARAPAPGPCGTSSGCGTQETEAHEPQVCMWLKCVCTCVCVCDV